MSSPVVTGNGKINANLDLDTTAVFDFQHINLTAFMSDNGESSKIWKLQASNVPSLNVKADSFQ